MLKNLRKRCKSFFIGDTRVMLWKKHRMLYVRIPKSGNSSICQAIEGAEKYRITATKIPTVYHDWTTFSFVRNPWDRLVSAYSHKASPNATSPRIIDGIYQGFIEKGIPIHANLSFEQFCEIACSIPDKKTDKHLQSQTHFLIRNGKPIVSFIGKLEQMQADWEKLMHRVGLSNQLPHVNKTKHEHYSNYFKNTALINLVGDRYAEDIRYFNYSFSRE